MVTSNEQPYVVVEFNLPRNRAFSEYERCERRGKAVESAVLSWYSKICARQPEQRETGAVMPWCTITFGTVAGAEHRPAKHVYVVLQKDSRSPQELLTKDERDALRMILGLPVRSGE